MDTSERTAAGARVFPAPMVTLETRVRAEWIDYNQHMNFISFVVAFDLATDNFWDGFGLDAAYRERTGSSAYVVETHLTYESQLNEGEALRITTRLLDHDEKRLHFIHSMAHAESSRLAATNELLFVNVDTGTGRATAFDAGMLATLDAIRASHQALAVPPQAGKMGIRRKGAER